MTFKGLFGVVLMMLSLHQERMMLGQAVQQPTQRPLIAVTIALVPESSQSMHKFRISLTIKNVSDHESCFPTASRMYRLHVDLNGVEPPKTEMHRHLLGEYRADDKSALLEGPIVCPAIAPGGQLIRYYDLEQFYDLSNAGKYNVSLDVLDEPEGPAGEKIWLRTNSVVVNVGSASQ